MLELLQIIGGLAGVITVTQGGHWAYAKIKDYVPNRSGNTTDATIVDSVTDDETDHTTQDATDVDANVDRPLTTTDIARDLVEEFAIELPEYFVFGTYDRDRFPDAETEHLEFIVATQAYGRDDISNATYWASHQSELAIFNYETAVDVFEILTVDDETLL